MLERLVSSREAIDVLCQRFGVRHLTVFGSAVTGGFDPDRSDVDLLVEFGDDLPMSSFDAYFGRKEALEELLGVPVDLVMPTALENPYFAANVSSSQQELYAA
jgi:uncharacterized protein